MTHMLIHTYMCVCMCIHTWMYIRVWVCIHKHACILIHVYTFTYVYTYAHKYIYTQTQTQNTKTYIYIYIYIYVCVCVCVCVCVHSREMSPLWIIDFTMPFAPLSFCSVSWKLRPLANVCKKSCITTQLPLADIWSCMMIRRQFTQQAMIRIFNRAWISICGEYRGLKNDSIIPMLITAALKPRSDHSYEKERIP